MIWKYTKMILPLLVQGCGIYTFSGISLPPGAKSFSVQFQTKVPQGPADLPERLQEQLVDKLLRQTPLRVVDGQGDLRWTGVVERFDYKKGQLILNSDGEQERQSLLSVVVEVTYVNPYDKKASFEKKAFAAYADVPANGDRAAEEPQLVEQILGKLVDNILDATVASW